jgi:hypothetical protein
VLLLLVIHCGAVAVLGQPPASAEMRSDIRKPSQDAGIDARAMVEALANDNRVPDLMGPVRLDPIFDTKYDWSEDRRVWGAIPVLVRNAENAWSELVRHLDDRRYCTTSETMNGFTYNRTVGDICREIVGRNLSEAYYRNMLPESELLYARLRLPEIARSEKALKSWCEERSKKSLYELQIEMCQWAIMQLKGGDFDQHISRVRLRAWVAAVEAEIESLHQSESAVHVYRFGEEEYIPYSREKAKKLRAAQQSGGKKAAQ